jgi:hypothetical protein
MQLGDPVFRFLILPKDLTLGNRTIDVAADSDIAHNFEIIFPVGS